jgi:hypothetical protein
MINQDSPGLSHGRTARGRHGPSIVSLGPAMPYSSIPCGRPPLKMPYGRFRGNRLQGGRPAVVFYPLGHPMTKLTPLAIRPLPYTSCHTITVIVIIIVVIIVVVVVIIVIIIIVIINR